MRHIHKIKNNDAKLSIVILAAHPGKRMKTYGIQSLLRINSKYTLIEHQLNVIDHVFHHIDHEIIIVTGYQSLKLIEHTPHKIVKLENENYNDTNEIRNLTLGLNAITTQDLLLIPGYCYFNHHALQFDRDLNTLVMNPNILPTQHLLGCMINPKQNIEHIMYGLNNVWTGITYLNHTAIDYLRKKILNKYYDNYFLFEFINKMIDQNLTFTSYINDSTHTITLDNIKKLGEIM